jgi:predicted lipoprotein
MTARRSRRRLGIVAALAIAGGVLAILRPWTIVPARSDTTTAFDPQGYVTSIWESRVLPTAHASAVELQAFLTDRAGAFPGGAGAPRAVFVKGTAIIADVDRSSRVGLARLRLPGAPDGRAAIQLGPVLRGTALRDALDFVRFTDFVNQLEFASVANALNDRVLSHVLTAVDVEALVGRDIAFVGAVPAAGASTTLEIVPVHLDPAGRAQ